MTRTRLLLLALLALLGSLLLTPARQTGAGSLKSAFSQSLGGMRVFIVDVLFLRAEQARALGDLDAARDLYGTLLQMQPGNAAATAHLINIEFELLRYVVDDGERFEQWRTLRRSLAEAIDLSPSSARLRYRDAQLILDVLRHEDHALAARITEHLGEPRFVALSRLAEASMLSDVIQGVGSNHVDTFAFLAVELAADALARGRTDLMRLAVDLGRAVLAEQQAMLGRMRHSKVAGADPTDLAAWVWLDKLLEWGLDTVEAVAADPASPAARAAVESFVARVGEDLQSVPRLRAAVGWD